MRKNFRRVRLQVGFFCALSVAIVASSLTSSSAYGNELRGIFKNNQGVRDFASEKGLGAFDDFTGALSDLPYSGEVHFNIGNSFLRNKEFEKALSEYQQALHGAASASRADRETRFRALFNSGVALTELKKNDEALEAYQNALAIKPDSPETKTNMELLAAQSGGGGEGQDQDKKDQKSDDKKNGDKKDQKDDKKDDKKDGQQNDKKPDKDDKDKDTKQPKQPEKFDNPKPSPMPFKSQDLTQQDVKRILEELKRQEEQIRARMENDKAKEAPPGKDW